MKEIMRKFLKKDRILIVDDEEINRELLGLILESDYDIIYAKNGQEAMDILKTQEFSLVLLDILMPVKDGFTVLKEMQEDPLLKKIPVIVLTSERKYEIECLKLGAADFIRKPYESHEIILARVSRFVELYNDKNLIDDIEEDEETTLLKKDFFVRYVDNVRQADNSAISLIVIKIDQLTMIKEIGGVEHTSSFMHNFGTALKEEGTKLNAFIARGEIDAIYVAIHTDNVDKFLDFLNKYSEQLALKVKVGVYLDVLKDVSLDIAISRAYLAINTLKNDMLYSVSYYDEKLKEKELFKRRLLADFKTAIKEKQFKIYIQPKFDIRGEKPVIAGGEALIRWIHPELGFISPGEFIPLLEENGLIKDLDLFVVNETVAELKHLKENCTLDLAISANVSRLSLLNSLYRKYLTDKVKNIGIEHYNFHVEVTESAFSSQVSYILEEVGQLKELGFPIEMDDFGTGYSSLNMFADMPFDVLKLDMGFIRNMHKSDKNRTVVSMSIDLAHKFHIPVVAEGVETEEQFIILKEMGCDYIQGYYLSKPLPLEEFNSLAMKEIR